MLRLHKRFLLVLSLFVLGIATAGMAWATIPDADGTVHLCSTSMRTTWLRRRRSRQPVIDPSMTQQDQLKRLRAQRDGRLALDDHRQLGGRHGRNAAFCRADTGTTGCTRTSTFSATGPADDGRDALYLLIESVRATIKRGCPTPRFVGHRGSSDETVAAAAPTLTVR